MTKNEINKLRKSLCRIGDPRGLRIELLKCRKIARVKRAWFREEEMQLSRDFKDEYRRWIEDKEILAAEPFMPDWP